MVAFDFETYFNSLPDGSVERALFRMLDERLRALENICEALRLDVNDLKKNLMELERVYLDDGR